MAKNRPDFKRKKRELETFLRQLPTKAGKQYVDFVETNFDKESFSDGGKWPARKSGEGKGKRRESRRALLVKTARLKNSFNYRAFGRNQVAIYTDVPYAQRHNEGLKGMPKRQFMGESEQFNKGLQEMIEKKLDNIFK